jgi:4-hydroxy-3-methylbut-2-enyl diphosphate reductase
MKVEQIVLAAPRGFCAGVSRAIEIVELALKKFGQPIYVKHEIVHNKIVVEDLRGKGVKFIEEIAEVPDGAVLIFSAHGVSSAIEDEAKKRDLTVIDASCPLVKKVHREVVKYDEEGFEIVLVGHKGHPELEGTEGRIKGNYVVVETAEDARTIMPKNPDKLALASQTTLSLDDTKEITQILQDRFPNIILKNDICYATQNRQNAVKAIVSEVDLLIVIGSNESSNSNRLRDIGLNFGVKSILINNLDEFDERQFTDVKIIGLTAGASAPEFLVEEVISFFKSKNPQLEIQTVQTAVETVVFHTPKEVRK